MSLKNICCSKQGNVIVTDEKVLELVPGKPNCGCTVTREMQIKTMEGTVMCLRILLQVSRVTDALQRVSYLLESNMRSKASQRLA